MGCGGSSSSGSVAMIVGTPWGWGSGWVSSGGTSSPDREKKSSLI